MILKELKSKVDNIITELKDNGKFPKENNHLDYKQELNIQPGKSQIENFLINFSKDIISFANADGGIILIGINEDKNTGQHNDVGLDQKNLDLLSHIDLNDVSQKFEKITKVGITLDLQGFQISTRKFYYLLIEKQDNILVPINDFPDYKLSQGAILYRASGKNEIANESTASFNRFLHMKANEKSKEFMEIWSKLLPEMVDINPREVLILNPLQNKVYGFNSKDNTLSGSEIEIDKTQNGVFNIILNAITAGEIGKITTNEGKPLYKIVGELQNVKEHIIMSTLQQEVKKITKYKFSNLQLKALIHYLKWVKTARFAVDNPSEESINPGFEDYLWIETTDHVQKKTKVFFSSLAISKTSEIINDSSLHQEIFGKMLELK
jgi:hypothetical protein